jgi:hypothetical protein
LNVFGVCDVRQTEINTAESLIPVPSVGEFEVAVKKVENT